MADLLKLRGVVVRVPEVYEGYTEFPLRTGAREYHIIRMNPTWQKRDILFLRAGQTVEMTGEPGHGSGNTVLAHRIIIAKNPDLQTEKEREHDTESI